MKNDWNIAAEFMSVFNCAAGKISEDEFVCILAGAF